MAAQPNREAWLKTAVEALTPLLADVNEKMVPVHVSVGWPGGRNKKSTTIGQCWASVASADGVPHIFISPVRGEDDTVKVLATLLHEMIHAVDDCESGHRGNFARIAKAVGFLPKLTSSDNASDDLRESLGHIARDIGTFPHAALALTVKGSEEKKKQTTRMLKVECPNTGYTVRTTRKWLDEVGAPICPCCQAPMAEPESKEV